MDLNQFIGKSQLSAMREACRGEEGAFFRAMMKELETTFDTTPKPLPNTPTSWRRSRHRQGRMRIFQQGLVKPPFYGATDAQEGLQGG